jgi:hypothetical protein
MRPAKRGHRKAALSRAAVALAGELVVGTIVAAGTFR